MARRTKYDRVLDALRDSFASSLATTFEKAFGVKIETHLDIFSLRMVSQRADGQDFDQRMRMFIEGFECAWNEATGAALAGAS